MPDLRKTKVINLYEMKKGMAANGVRLFAASFIFASSLWYLYFFGYVPFEQVLFYMRAPAEGANMSPVLNYVVICLPGALVLTRLLQSLLRACSNGRRRAGRTKAQRFAAMRVATVSLLSVSVVFGLWSVDVMPFMVRQFKRNPLAQYYYVNPCEAGLRFPEKKQNLIYLFMESMEGTYAAMPVDGDTRNLIPNLTAIADSDDSVHFCSDGEGVVGGAVGIPAIGWTSAGMVAQTSGLPLRVTLFDELTSEDGKFLPGACALGDILRHEGYHLEMVLGSDASFGSRRDYLTSHGGFEIDDLYTEREAGRLPEDYFEFWGFEDRRLFERARTRLPELAEAEKPFCYVMLTVDTHFPDGYTYDDLPAPYESAYANAIGQSDHHIGEFVTWFREQPFAKDTTLILAGDHLSMANTFFLEMDRADRSIYTAIINPRCDVAKGSDPARRRYTAVDMFPTTLAALGVTATSPRLGLGVNLFSGEPTLLETLGETTFNRLIAEKSDFLDEEILAHELEGFNP